MKYIIAALIGYLIGSINPAYVISTIKGVNLREIGSKNLGASNVKMALGWGWFFAVMLLDTHKSYVAMQIVAMMYPACWGVYVLAGACAVIGHMFPFYLKFKGGKGFASLIGVIYGMNFFVGVATTVLGLAVAYFSNWIVGATITFCILSPITTFFLNKQELIAPIAIFVVCAIIMYLHIPNFIRVKNKKEIGINGCYVGTKIKCEEDIK